MSKCSQSEASLRINLSQTLSNVSDKLLYDDQCYQMVNLSFSVSSHEKQLIPASRINFFVSKVNRRDIIFYKYKMWSLHHCHGIIYHHGTIFKKILLEKLTGDAFLSKCFRASLFWCLNSGLVEEGPKPSLSIYTMLVNASFTFILFLLRITWQETLSLSFLMLLIFLVFKHSLIQNVAHMY